MPTLHFKGKTFVQNHHLAVKYHHLVPKKEFSLTDKVSLYDNMIIKGDNLIALKALLRLKYVDHYTLLEHRIDFCQLPYEIL